MDSIRRITLILLLGATSALAEVVKVEIEDRQAFAEGMAFGNAGAYERIKGTLWIEVDPADPANGRVVDLELAPTTPAGKVRFPTEFFLLKPVDARRGNGCLLYDVNNRGNKLALAAFNEARGNGPLTRADAGNGFLMRRGYSILWTGWNGDVMPGEGRIQIELPVARGPEGPITGRVYSEFCVDKPSFSEPLCGGSTRVYPAASLDNATATLSMRARRSADPVDIPHDRWAFARFADGQPVPDPTFLYLKDGYRPGWLYDLVYVARDPRVSGLGAVAVRDAVSFFRYGTGEQGDLANPLAGALDRALVFGISQSGRFIHHFLWQDFNSDERGRMVFDAAFSHVGSTGKAIFNTRFAQITRHGSQHEEHLFPTDVFPFNTVAQSDPMTGQRGDWLGNARSAGHLPKLFITQTSSEYWVRGGSLLHTDIEGRQDAPIDPQVRLYHVAGGHHLFFTPPEKGACRYDPNAVNYRPVLRALLVALDGWTKTGVEPPPSRYPRIADGTLVDFETWRRSFPRLPGVALPDSPYAPLRLDPGPRWASDGIADHVPPIAGPPYRVLVPTVDEDGNERAGIHLPDVAVPVGTHAGWNLRGKEYGADGMLMRWVGATFPFARTPAEREQIGDPRPSITERYPDRQGYLERIKQVAEQLARERFLLEEDLPGIQTATAEQENWP